MTSKSLLDSWRCRDLALSPLDPSSQRRYLGDVSRFLKSLPDCQTKNDLELVLAEVNGARLRSFFAQLLAEGYNPQTIKRVSVGVRRFFAFCCERRLLSINPLEGFELGLGPLPIKEWPPLSPDFLKQLRERVREKSPSFLPSRDLLILELISLGVDPSGLAKLKVDNLDLGGNRLCWLRRDHTRSHLLLSSETRILVGQYLAERATLMSHWGKDHPQFFIGRRAEPISDRQMRRQLSLAAKEVDPELGSSFDLRRIKKNAN